MNPYHDLPPSQFWKASVQAQHFRNVGFDYGQKFSFSLSETFATAGSCFAQHFAAKLVERGGKVLIAESRHPLVSSSSDHGYGVFSARYGNIYTVRQLLELLQQATGVCPMVEDFALRADGRWVDMLRPRAVPMGFATWEHACADRVHHLLTVRQMLRAVDVFVFTLGLTETWFDAEAGYCYPVVPGAIAGTFIPGRHQFRNFGVGAVVADLEAAIALIKQANSAVKLLFTVSPVALVATAEPRSVLVSTCASKSILRAAVDEAVSRHSDCDYFPSFEIITGPYSRGRFWAEGLRDVTEAGVETVMDVFFHSRMNESKAPSATQVAVADEAARQNAAAAFEVALTRECDEMFLDRSLRSSPAPA